MRDLFKGVLVISVLFVMGCGSGSGTKGGELVVAYDQDMMKEALISQGIADENTTVFGYVAYKIPYKTTDENDIEVEVSGLMVVPTGLPDGTGLSLVSDDHGTIFANYEAPTVIAETTGAPDGAPIIFTALAGFVTLQPDYIGFGDSTDTHPFVLKKSLANATVDFITAARKFAIDNNINLNGQLFLTGYSEGGYAALATLQKIEADGEIEVAMTAPMAGPYAMNEMAMGVLIQPALSVPSFMANVGYSYANAYGKDLNNTINEPYASKLETLFNGDFNRTQIDAELTIHTTGEHGLFNEVFVNDFFLNNNNWFKQAMIENNVHTWGPQTPVRLVHCEGDKVIPYDISLLAEATMNAYNATDVSIVPVEDTLGIPNHKGHADCGPLAYQVAAGMFTQARFNEYGY